MNIDKDAKMGNGNTIMEFNIGHIEHLVPSATTIINNYYGTRKQTQIDDQEPANPEIVREEILQYVVNTLQYVVDSWKDKYMTLWADILELPEVKAVIYDKGQQGCTNFNRKEVCHILCYLGKYADGGLGVFKKYVASRIAGSLPDGKQHTTRPELGFRPSHNIQEAIDKLIKEKYK